MKKILSVLLAAVMVFGILPVAVSAADGPIEIYANTYIVDAAGNPIHAVTLGGGKNYKLVAGEHAVIKEDQIWTVEEGSQLFVYGFLEIRGKLIVNGFVTAIDDGKVVAKCWKDGDEYKYATILHSENICGNETAEEKRYFAELHVPTLSGGFVDPSHALSVKYLMSRTGHSYDYLYSDLFFDSLYNTLTPDPSVTSPKWSFADLYGAANTAYSPDTELFTVPLNQYLFLYFDFTVNGEASKKYDGNRMAILFNRDATPSKQGVCSLLITNPGVIEYYPAALINTGLAYNTWEDSYFVRQVRIHLPSGDGYTVYGVNGELSSDNQTVRLNYGEEFKFRVAIDSQYSDSDYSVYLVQSYLWDTRDNEDELAVLVNDTYIDEHGDPQHYVWKFAEGQAGDGQKIYIDSYGIYHIVNVDDEYHVMVSGVYSNQTLSVAGNIMDTIRNLLNAIKQFFDRVKQMLGL